MDHLLAEISKIGIENNINKVILFGSRARGDNSEKSDYDIAFVSANITAQLKSAIAERIDEIDTFHKIDVVFLKDLRLSILICLTSFLQNWKLFNVLILAKYTEGRHFGWISIL